jgi:N-acetylmuramoyl-L-alanine amidase
VKRLTFLFFSLLLLPVYAGAPRVGGVEMEPHKYYDNFFIKTVGDLVPRPMLLDGRLVVDFKGAEVEKAESIEIEKSSRVKTVRIGQFSTEPPVARVVFDLRRSVKFDAASILGKGKVQIEIADADGYKPVVNNLGIEVRIAEPRHKESAPTLEAVKIEKIEPPPEKPIPAKKPKTAKLPLKGKLFVVDPGHGGDDPGAEGPGGVWEKDVNLKTATYLTGYLRQMGATVYQTRTRDVRRTLKYIADFTNRSGADAYISVHFNSIDNPRISGTETHYYSPFSYKMAEAVHKHLLKGIRRQDRGVIRTMLYTIHHAKMPAILVEPVYLTHFQDGMLIKSKSFQKEVARDISLGLEEFFHVR